MRRTIALFTLLTYGALTLTRAADLELSATLEQPRRKSEDTNIAFVVHAVLTNRSTTTTSLSMMSCSWDESWKVSSNVKFEVLGWDCAKNDRRRWDLAPGESIAFDFWIDPRDKVSALDEQQIKLGFAPLSTRGSTGTPAAYHENERIWSDALDLPKMSSTFSALTVSHRIEKMPTKQRLEPQK